MNNKYKELRINFPLREPDFSVFIEGNPISENHMRRVNIKTGIPYLTAQARDWRESVYFDVLSEKNKQGIAFIAPLAISCSFNRMRRNSDIDNKLKLIFDGIVLAIGIDDQHFYPFQGGVFHDLSLPKGVLIDIWNNNKES